MDGTCAPEAAPSLLTKHFSKCPAGQLSRLPGGKSMWWLFQGIIGRYRLFVRPHVGPNTVAGDPGDAKGRGSEAGVRADPGI